MNRPLLPLFALLLLDVLLILAAVGANFLSRKPKSSRKATKQAKRVTKAFTFASKEARSKRYHNLEDGEVNLHLESKISGVRRTPTGFLAAMNNDYAFEDSTYSEYVEKPDPDIQQFI